MYGVQISRLPQVPQRGDEIVNEHLWGKRLAEFVRDTLPQYGVQKENISSEDWGWMADIRHDAFPVWIGCGILDEPDGDDDEVEDGDALALKRTLSQSTGPSSHSS